MASPSNSTGKHPNYRGIRCRSGKWVSEIREPRKTTRIWLGTYPTPEMAAAAFDAAALALKGGDAVLNFPNATYPSPASLSSAEIRKVASEAADAKQAELLASENDHNDQGLTDQLTNEYLDDDELLNYPYLLEDMANGMLVSPPRIRTMLPDNSPDNSGGDSLWSYY
ncbi:hypothetical protein ACFE04_014026 [Oxalis oulophora]